ncbi:hypothetical protein [Floccifex sp.]|uniref:hypothetical protein n=1 Tax=Floccifex sp. TaxID=2815810 RepID=UPI003F119AAD
MKNHYKEIILFLFQLFMFYIFPLTAGPTDAMGMVFIIIIMTFILSIFMGLTQTKIKYIYPILNSIFFIPSVFIYYNETAFIHALWYFVISSVGLLIGIFMMYLKRKIYGHNN